MFKIYVGNLSFDTTKTTLESTFAAYGTVESAEIITDRDTGRSRGFGFVEMNAEDAQKAMDGLNGTDLDGRTLRVNEATPRENRGGGGGGGRRGGDRRGGGGGGYNRDRY